MANASIPLTNVGSGYTIVTQVIPSSGAPPPAGQNSCQTHRPLQKFLKVEPKALGTVEIMTGMWMFGIVLMSVSKFSSLPFGLLLAGSLFHILAGVLTVLANNKLQRDVIKCTMAANILSAVFAAVSVIIFFMNLMFGLQFSYIPQCIRALTVILLLFSLLQFAVSISVSAFTCIATCGSQPTLNVVSVIPNPEEYVPVDSFLPARHAHPGVSTVNAVAMGNLPEERPPPYDELKSVAGN